MVVTNSDDGTTTLEDAIEFISDPAVSGITPAGGPATGGTEITISGSDFQDGATVTVDGAECADPVVNTTNQTIICTTPEGTPGDPEIVITNPDQGAVTVNNEFTYVSVPTIDEYGVLPTGGTNTGGTEITIIGTGYLPDAEVYLGDTSNPANKCTSVVVNAEGTQITCTTPAGSNGATDVTVVNPDAEFGLGTATADSAFTYVTPPTVSDIGPDNGSGIGGTVVTIDGADFESGAAVTIGGIPCTPVTVLSSTQLTCVTGAHEAGQVDVVVTNSNGGSATIVNGFTYDQSTPTVTSISPDGGNNSGGTTITIEGTDFGAGAVVMIGDIQCIDIHVVANTKITCTTPAQDNGTYDVTVTNADEGTVTSADAFTYVTPPTVSGVSPKTGSTAGGETVTIGGENFGEGVTVTISGKPCVPLTRVSATKLTCKAPAGAAGKADIVVTNLDHGTVTSKDAFTYVKPASSVVKPNQKPAKLKVKGKATASKFKVNWSKPKDTSARRPVTKYILTVQVKGRSKVIILRNLPKSRTSYTLTHKQLKRALGLRMRGETTGTLTFLVKVRAVNAKGKGPVAKSLLRMKLR